MKKKKKTGNVIRLVILIAALLVFLVSGWQLLKIYMEYKKGSDEYKSLAGEADKIMESLEADSGISRDPGASGSDQAAAEEQARLAKEFYETMLKENEDYVGWIKIEDTKINYPIVQFVDNDYYLTHTFDRAENAAGALFLDYQIAEGMEGKNLIVYGHNMKNGSMFANLKKYRDDDFYESHKTFQVYTETGFYTYEIFAVYETEPVSEAYTLGFADDGAFMDYIQKAQARSIQNTGVTVEADDRIITLSTCVNNNEDRLIVQAKRLDS